jgi:DNA-binding NarL/FixJ family response regulator
VPAPGVLIVSSQTLFAESLRGLLEHHGYHVIGVRPYDDTVPVLVATAQPSLVILDVGAVPPSATTTLLDCAHNIRIVQVSLDSRVIALYDRRESSATVQDFLSFVGPLETQPEPPEAEEHSGTQGNPPDSA